MKNVTPKEKASPLVEYLRTPQPMYALLLNGPWGVGKSFYWQRFVENELPDLKKSALSISVAGLTTLEEIERALFMASIKKAPGIITETSGVIGKAILRWAKVDPEDITLKAELKIGKTVICIDDLERFAGDFSILFGFIVSLVDEAQLHVVLIANEEKVPVKYSEIKEKIVGRTVGVPLDLRGFYKFSVGNVGGIVSNVRKALAAFEDEAVAIFEGSNLKNLRTVRAIVYEMGLMLGAVSWPKDGKVRMRRLFSAVAFHVMATADDAENDRLVADAFLTANIGRVLAIRDVSRRQTGGRVGGKEDGEEEKSFDRIHALIKRFARSDGSQNWPRSPSFASFVLGGPFDAESIIDDFKVFEKDADRQSALTRIQYRHGMTDQEFASAVVELEDDISKGRFKYAMELWAAFEFLYAFSRRYLTRFSPSEATGFFMSALEKIDAAKIEDASMHLAGRPLDENQQRVLTAIEKIGDEVTKRKDDADNKDILERVISGIPDDPPKSVIQPYKKGLFDNEDPKDLLLRIQAGGVESIERMIRFLVKRRELTDAVHHFAGEDVFAMQIAKLIRKGIRKARPMSLTNSTLLDLAQEFEDLARTINPSAHKPNDHG